jgi:secondary thiamine-phosphate synthase enzyme
VDSAEISLRTGTQLVTDVTAEVTAFCRSRGDGLVSIFLPHATAGLALLETGSGTEEDLAEVVDRVLPPDSRWHHGHGSLGHGRDHVLPAFVSPSLVLPVAAGRPQLGTWQSVVVVDPNRDNPDRRLRLSFLAG